MRLSNSFFCSIVAAISASVVSGASLGVKRQVAAPFSGIIVEPAAGTTITAGQNFDFSFTPDNFCEDSFTNFGVWLVQNEPTFADLDSSGGFPEGSFLVDFGTFTITNFGLPPSGTPPPATLTVPDLGIPSGEVFFAVVEIDQSCPGNVPLEFALTSNQLTYDA